MPRGSRIDYPGLLQHVIVRGIEKKNIFSDEHDYQDFVARLENRLGIPGSCLARKLGLTKSGISKLNKRGEVLIKEEGEEVITGVLG